MKNDKNCNSPTPTRINLTKDQKSALRAAYKQLGFRTMSSYIRYIMHKKHEEINSKRGDDK